MLFDELKPNFKKQPFTHLTYRDVVRARSRLVKDMLNGYRRVGYNRIFTRPGFEYWVEKFGKAIFFRRSRRKRIKRRVYRMVKYFRKLGELGLPHVMYQTYHTTQFELLFYFQIETYKKALKRLPWGVVRYFATLHNVPNYRVVLVLIDSWVPEFLSIVIYPCVYYSGYFLVWFAQALISDILEEIELRLKPALLRKLLLRSLIQTLAPTFAPTRKYILEPLNKYLFKPIIRPVLRPTRKIIRFL